MPRNVEIKARATKLQKQIADAAAFADGEAKLINQHDVFYRVASGRLKLRTFNPQRAELIYYHRADQSGPAMSNYQITPTGDPAGLHQILADAYGILGTVIKQRTLLFSGRTRMHFDRVEQLGDFIELEVVLGEDEALEMATLEAQELMSKLGIMPEDLIEAAYIDLLSAQQ